MNNWKKTFAEKLDRVQSSWVSQFDEALDSAVAPVFSELAEFLRQTGFKPSVPMHERGRRSFKFELAEDAYLLLIFRSVGLGAFELSRESFVPGGEPNSLKTTERVADLSKAWAQKQFQTALDAFVNRLGGDAAVEEDEAEELLPV